MGLARHKTLIKLPCGQRLKIDAEWGAGAERNSKACQRPARVVYSVAKNTYESFHRYFW